MVDILQEAKKLVEQIRFTGDTFRDKNTINLSQTNVVKDFSYTNDLLISNDVTPLLYKSLNSVYKRLHIPKDAVEAFVFSSPEIQAECYTGDKTECVIRFSSALVQILNEKEFEFVAGHEIGHFLFGHRNIISANQSFNIEFYMQKRAQEISVDRVGFLACESLNTAIQALMKTISGLTERHLRFDVGAFLSQLQKPSNYMLDSNMTSTHPSILVRCRALLWFSFDDYFSNNLKKFSRENINKLDKRIQSDLDKYVDGPAKNQIEKVKENLAIWMSVYEIVQDKLFSKNEQDKFAQRFGKDTLDRLKNYLKDIPESEVENIIYERLKAAREELEMLIPNSFESEIQTISKWKS